jgi:hypothetical protein
MIFNEGIIFEHREEKCHNIHLNYFQDDPFQASYTDQK